VAIRKALEIEEAGKALWPTAYVNDLPDSAFLYVEPGGKKDGDGKTVPRTLRHFPYKDKDGKIDLPHLRNAIARIPQASIPGDMKEKLQERARGMLEDQKGEKVQKSEEETYSVEVRAEMPILKKQEEKRLVTGIILEPETVDGQGDVVSSEVIERAAHNFLSGYNRETQMGVLHRMFGEIGVELVESWIAPTQMKFGNEDVKEGTWLMTCRVLDDPLWKKIKAGEITGFSIGGSALVAAVRNS
jgi:hypothetical protein